MTQEQYNKAKNILRQINEYNKRRNSIEKLLERIKDIELTNEQKEEHISIKLDEQWLYTPGAEVKLIDLKFFLEKEIEAISKVITDMEDEFLKI